MTVCLACGWVSRGPLDRTLAAHFVQTDEGWRCGLREPEPAGELVETRDGRLVVRGPLDRRTR